MTRLGYSNPVIRLGWIVRGLLFPPTAPAADDRRTVRVIGHRGLARECPENTIASFSRAIEAGADAIETDICRTRDGHFVLWHDNDPDERLALLRQIGAEKLFVTPDVPMLGSPWRRRVSELTLAELREHYGYSLRGSLAADLADGDTKPSFPIATLDELFSWAPSERRLRDVCLDVKLRPDQGEAATELARVVERFTRSAGERAPRFHLLTPQREIIPVFLRDLSAATENGWLDAHADFELPGALPYARRLNARHVSMGAGERRWTGFRAELETVLTARERRRIETVIVWTVNRRSRLEELVARRVDGVITDEVALLRELLGEAREEVAAGSVQKSGTSPAKSGFQD